MREADMTEVPGTDRDEARKHLLEEVPLAPEDVEGADDDPTTDDEGGTGDEAKPAAGSTEFVT